MTKTNIECWEMRAIGEPLARATRVVDEPPPGQVLVRVAGCGVCHTDLGFLFDGVRPRHELPLTLGHEISGVVEQVGAGAEQWLGKSVVVPAVIPCGECELCETRRGSICRAQIFPGCDVHGGFASHVQVPSRGLCPVDEETLAASGVELVELAVLADAISTPYQAILRANLKEGDVAVFVGVGGVGGFGVQLANASGAVVFALDVESERLARMQRFGAAKVVNVRGMDDKAVRRLLQKEVKAMGASPYSWKIFETSGTSAGQKLAFSLLTFGAVLSVVGYQLEPVSIRLSNLMAFDASAQGNWGCLPEYYPAALDKILSGQVKVAPFVERRPMQAINDTFEALREHRLTLRPILEPDFA